MLSRLGASVRDVTLPSLQDWNACGWLIIIAEAYSVHEPWLKTRYNDYGKNFRDRVTLGAFISSADYMAAIRFRRELQEKLARVMTDIDLLVLPTALMPAPLLTEGSSYSHLETPNFTMHGIGFGNEYQPAAGVPVLQRWQRHVSDGCAEPAEHFERFFHRRAH
jgi:aspartyl-tRNA(Asn)/glutamyl-tRNA(Gln) amidotransferase subunit A